MKKVFFDICEDCDYNNQVMQHFIHNISLFLASLGFSLGGATLLAVLIFLTVVSGLYFGKSLVIIVIELLERKVRNGRFAVWLNVIEQLNIGVILLNGVYFASIVLPLPAVVHEFMTGLYLVATVIFMIGVIRAIVLDSVKVYFRAKGNVSPEALKTMLSFVGAVMTIGLWLLAALVILQISRVDTQALLGGLGIASVIAAFSFQNALRDIFAFFTIYIDRSFAVGDYVKFGNYQGTIKEIRIRTTRIKALRGSDLVVSNYELTNSVIENYKPMKKRRVSLTFSIEPGLTADQIAAVVTAIKQVFFRADIADRVELNTVVVDDLTSHGIQLQIIYRFIYLPGQSNYLQHLAYKEKVNLGIVKVLADNEAKLVYLPVAVAVN